MTETYYAVTVKGGVNPAPVTIPSDQRYGKDLSSSGIPGPSSDNSI